MSKSPSNIYAEKVFSEHPVSLWPLDDEVSFISLIGAQNKDLTSWNVTEGTVSEETSISTQPFVEENLYKITGNPSTTLIKTTTLTSDDIINFQDMTNNISTFCISSFFYSSSIYLASVSIGYSYIDINTAEEVEVLEEVPITVIDKWFLISKTFSVVNQNTTMKIVIKITYSPSEDASSEYEFFLNGLNVGQNSEEFVNYLLGSNVVEVPSSIAIEASDGIIARSYSSDSNYGYYLVNNNYIYSKNFGVPLVYGASNTTRLFPNYNIDESPKPSIIFPGFGFLNESGRYNTYTVEMWMRIMVDTPQNKKIFGPISSTDGLYADDCFLTLVINNEYKSVFIEEWGSPMLIQISYLENQVLLYLNGEKVIDMIFDSKTISLPSKLNEEEKDQDWLGFYSYTDINPIEIDCFSIYPYIIPEIISKKRWVYGQAVKSYASFDSSYSGKSAFIDYGFSNYGINYSYPNIGKWNQGKIDNLIYDNNQLSTPNYELPIINIENQSLSNWYQSCSEQQDEDYYFITFNPNEEIDVNGYMLFNKFDMLEEPLSAIHGVFKTDELINATILYINNKTNLDYFSIRINDSSKIIYEISVNGVITLIDEQDYEINNYFEVGIEIDSLVRSFGKDVATFFGNKSSLEIILLNNKDIDSCFNKKLYKFGFSTRTNFVNNYQDFFNINGIIKENSRIHDHMYDTLASYTLFPQLKYNNFHLDIGINSYWEDYIPLKYFGKYVNDSSNKKVYTFDSLQFNIGFPSPSIFKETEGGEWTYGQLNEKFSTPIQQTYEVLDNTLYTGYNNYEDLQYNRSDLFYEYDTTNSIVKHYISFQFVEDKINKKFNSFDEVYPALKSGLLNLDNYSNWQNSLFLVENGTIIYPPSSVNFEDLAIVVHLVFSNKTILNRKINIKNLELASRSLNKDSFTSISTSSGVNLYPYTKNGIYYDYNGKNPFSIYKKSNPYLYLGRYSGIRLRGDFSTYQNRGISMLINQNKETNYSVATMQISMKNSDEKFSATPIQIFEVENVENTIKFYTVGIGSDGKRGKIYAINSRTGELENGISYYINGTLVANPVIDVKVWNFIGIAFGSPLKFNSFIGSIKINGPYTYNHISYYKLTSLQQRQSSINRYWSEVKEQYILGNQSPYEFDWDFWNEGYLWYGVFIKTSVSNFGDIPSNIYRSYMGTNKIIVGSEGEQSLVVKSYADNVYVGSSWKQYISTPT